MSGNNDNDENEKIDNTTKFFYSFTQGIFNSDKSIRWVAITDQEENQESAVNTIIRQKTRIKFEQKIGKLSYVIGRYEKLNRVTIPINNEKNYYLLLTMDFDQYDFDKIITERIIPLIKQEKENL